MIKNKYLDDLGIPQNQYGTNFCDERTDKRAKRWEEQKKIYGFDEVYGHTESYKIILN